jgi:GntR family transcriptional regulator/MocR family aminotransferase
MSPERVIYIGSASKMLAPSLRMGWLVLPNELVAAVVQKKLSADRGSPALEQLALAHFIEAGELDRHLRRTRTIYAKRREALIVAIGEHLPRATLRGVAAGLHVLLELPRGTDESKLVTAAERSGVRVYGASQYYANPQAAPPALLLGYGGVAEQDIAPGIRELARLVNAVQTA